MRARQITPLKRGVNESTTNHSDPNKTLPSPEMRLEIIETRECFSDASEFTNQEANGEKMKLVSVNVGLPRDVISKGRVVTTGIFKEPVEGLVRLRTLNLDGDRQAD